MGARQLPSNKEQRSHCLKWVFKTKYNEDGSVQQPSLNFNETFALVTRLETIRTAFAIAAHFELKVYQLDVKLAFLNEELQKEVYVERP